MDRFDAAAMAFHTSNELGFGLAQRVGNQIAASAWSETCAAEPEVVFDERTYMQLQALDDAICALLSIGEEDSGAEKCSGLQTGSVESG